MKRCIFLILLPLLWGCTKVNRPLGPHIFKGINLINLISPENGAEFGLASSISFEWNDVSGATKYQIQIDNDSTFYSPVVDVDTLQSNSYLWNDTQTGIFYWRVRAGNGYFGGMWSRISEFKKFPYEVGYYDTPDWDYAYGVYVLGDYAYVADGFSGLRIIRVKYEVNDDFAYNSIHIR